MSRFSPDGNDLHARLTCTTLAHAELAQARRSGAGRSPITQAHGSTPACTGGLCCCSSSFKRAAASLARDTRATASCVVSDPARPLFAGCLAEVGGQLVKANLGWPAVFGLLNVAYYVLHYMFASQVRLGTTCCSRAEHARKGYCRAAPLPFVLMALSCHHCGAHPCNHVLPFLTPALRYPRPADRARGCPLLGFPCDDDHHRRAARHCRAVAG